MADNKLELVVEIDTKQANASIKSVNASLTSMEAAAVKTARGAAQGIDGMTASMAKAVAAGQLIYSALSAAARAMREMTVGAIETQDQIGKTAQRIGMSTEAFSALRHAAELSDVTMDQLTGSLARFARNIATGSTALDALGVAVRRSDGATRDMDQILSDVAERFSSMPDGVQKTALAVELFGRGGAALIPLLNQGAGGLAAMAREARELGRVIDTETATQAEELNDNITRLKGAAEGLAFELARQLVPRAIDVTQALLRWVRDGGLDRIAGYLRDAAEWARNIGAWIIQYAVVRNVLELAAALRTAAVAAGALNAALLANPWGLAAAGVATLGVALWREKERLDQYQESMTKAAEKAALLKQISEGATLEELKRKGYDEAAIRAAIGAPAASAATRPRIAFDMEDVQALDEARTKAAEAEKRAADLLREARESELSGLARVIVQYQRYREELGLSAKAQRDVAAAAEIRIRAELEAERKRRGDEMAADIDRQQDLRRRALADEVRAQIEFQNETLQREMETARARLGYEETVAEQMRDARLRDLDTIQARTVESQIAVVQERLRIEEDYLMRRFALRADELRRESEIEIATIETIARARGIAEEEIAARRDAILQNYGERARQLEADTRAAIDAARQNAAVRQAQLIRDQNQRIFASFKRQAEGVFDALLTKSQSVWSAIGNALKTALLTAIKEVVSSNVAAMLMRLFTGARIPVAGGGLAGLLGLGAAPAFGATGGIVPGVTPGTTPPFMPSGGLGSLGGFGFSRAGLAAALPQIGLLGAGFGLMGAFRLGQGGGVGRAFAPAIGAVSGMLGFGALASMFPVLAAAGPFGLIAAAGIGAFVGLMGLFRKSAEQKAREKIKATYGVDIREKNILTQIVNIAKQGFGGNLDMAIRSQQIRDLVELYAMSTGQSTSGIPATVRPVSLLQLGGSLFQSSSSGLTLDRVGSGAPSSAAAPTVINITVPGAKEFFEKETVRVVVDNPRAVQSAAMTALRSNAGRRETAALQLTPGLITS
ncbi:MAG: hypothetical protein KatS3mg004_1861 [Bryobacteraceae bacterium]|nr:MAG: hypothetical protein KatS3mg004_1861 [Bryobacteraceae bacterium]